MSPIYFAIALVVWIVGLGLTSPIWWGLHNLGMRCWSLAAPLGAALLGGAALLLTGLSSEALWIVPPMALIGAVVGFVVWKVAYSVDVAGVSLGVRP